MPHLPYYIQKYNCCILEARALRWSHWATMLCLQSNVQRRNTSPTPWAQGTTSVQALTLLWLPRTLSDNPGNSPPFQDWYKFHLPSPLATEVHMLTNSRAADCRCLFEEPFCRHPKCLQKNFYIYINHCVIRDTAGGLAAPNLDPISSVPNRETTLQAFPGSHSQTGAFPQLLLSLPRWAIFLQTVIQNESNPYQAASCQMTVHSHENSNESTEAIEKRPKVGTPLWT